MNDENLALLAVVDLRYSVGAVVAVLLILPSTPLLNKMKKKNHYLLNSNKFI